MPWWVLGIDTNTFDVAFESESQGVFSEVFVISQIKCIIFLWYLLEHRCLAVRILNSEMISVNSIPSGVVSA